MILRYGMDKGVMVMIRGILLLTKITNPTVTGKNKYLTQMYQSTTMLNRKYIISSYFSLINLSHNLLDECIFYINSFCIQFSVIISLNVRFFPVKSVYISIINRLSKKSNQ